MCSIPAQPVFQKYELSASKALVRSLTLSFAGAPSDAHAEVSLWYLGDLEISEDATLGELKSQVSLPPAANPSGDLAASNEILIYSSISFSLNYSLF